MPSSIVTTAGSGNSTISAAPSSSRCAVPLPFATSSFDTAVTQRQAEQLGRHRVRRRRSTESNGVLAEQIEIVAAALELRGERLRDGEAVERHRRLLSCTAAIRAHAQRLADRLLHGVGPERDDDDLAAGPASP